MSADVANSTVLTFSYYEVELCVANADEQSDTHMIRSQCSWRKYKNSLSTANSYRIKFVDIYMYVCIYIKSIK